MINFSDHPNPHGTTAAGQLKIRFRLDITVKFQCLLQRQNIRENGYFHHTVKSNAPKSAAKHPRSHLRAELTDKSGSYQGVDHLIALQNRFHCRKNILAGYQLFRLTGVDTGRTAYTVLINRKLPVASYFNCVKQTAGLTFRRFARIAAAIAYLPNFESYDADNRGRAHQAAAVAFKAKTYAYWATWDATQWNNVIEMVNQLENNYNRDLAPTFAELFSSDLKDYWNAEYLWTIPSIGGALPGGTEFPGIILENKGWGKYNGWGQMKPSYDIYEEMAKDGKGNDRLVRSILEYNQEFPFFGETRKFWSTSDLEAGFMINKYMDAFKYSDPVGEGAVSANGDWPTVRVNFPIIRFAEMLLFRAEAYLMTGQADKATADINRIRLRSNLTPLAGTATMKDLYHERRCELAFEFTDHLFDLKRWNRSSNTDIKTLADKELNAHPRIRRYEDRANPESAFTITGYEDYTNKNAYQAHMMVFPYPSEEITKSNGQLKQNEGY